MNRLEISRERRRQSAFQRLGTNAPRCGCCGETDWRCFEAHHVAGRKRDAATVVLCTNCHRKVTDDQKDHPSMVRGGDELLQQVGHFLLGLADILRLIVDKLVAFADALIARAQVQAEVLS